jgi:hypothetical protein
MAETVDDKIEAILEALDLDAQEEPDQTKDTGNLSLENPSNDEPKEAEDNEN